MKDGLKLGLGIIASVGIGVGIGLSVNKGFHNSLVNKENEFKPIFINAGISEDEFAKMGDSIIKAEPLSAGPDAREKMRVLAWEKEVEKLNVKKAYDAGKAFVRDSIANATKLKIQP